jgi:hypothetical protein
LKKLIFISQQLLLGKNSMCASKFHFKQGKNAMNTSKNLEVAFGELIMGIIQLLGWFYTFKSGMTSAKYVECSGHSSMSTSDEDVPDG